MKTRCPWVPTDNSLYIKYHDQEWGIPVHDDKKHFEFLILEGAQAGLSWLTILKRREGYRRAFANFDPKKVAEFTDAQLEKLCQNPEIIRNRLKIYAARQNARSFLEIQKEFSSFDKYAWQFVHGKPIQHQIKTIKDYPTTSKEAEAFSKDLQKRGFKFVGPTIIYAHMQAIGMVNDHTLDCFRYNKVHE